ncbi:MAG TPA: hypothetical protein VFN30_04980, partial [Chitinophagaceae bacterium]|nr:hypothetical protein [Chitinophagaceae bacterium]
RFIYSRKKEILSSPKFKYNHIYCLQPRYAVTLHIFRRVLPFAILNLKTSSVFHKNLKSKATEISNYLTSYFSLQPIPVLTKEEATSIPDLKSHLIVLTGKESTFCLLKNTYHNSAVIGSLGTSGIVLAPDLKQGKLFLENQAPLKQSCTNISSVIIPKLKRRSKPYYDTSDNLIYTLNQILSKYNPTIIYDISNHFKKSDVKKSGYRIIQHQDKGLLSGICADPIHGYPGDYTL